jgi:hypothetical protein
MRFKVGDKVRIVSEVIGHEFEIGEEVIIVETDDGHQDYVATGIDHKEQYFVIDEEIEPIEE